MKRLKQCCSILQAIMSQATPYPLTILETFIKPTAFFETDTYTPLIAWSIISIPSCRMMNRRDALQTKHRTKTN